jgi:NADH-quinone oxidoreductase subunit B
MWGMTFGTACCAIEMMSVGSARYDTDRFGIFFRNSPRQADCMIVSGTINLKMAPRLKLLYEQMAAPKYVIAMGACAVGGGPFSHGYNVVNGVDLIVPVDVHIPGCPARPEALIDGLLMLMERNAEGIPSAAERYAAEVSV